MKNFPFFSIIIFILLSLCDSTEFKREEGDFSNYNVPHIIWLFWDGKWPVDVRYILHSVKERINNYTLILLNKQTIRNYIDTTDYPKYLPLVPSANQADYYRFHTLYDYGGLWMDSTILIKNQSCIDKLFEEVIEKKAEVMAFNSWAHPNYNIELFFLISPSHSPFFEKVIKEIDISLNMGRKKYMWKRVKEGITLLNKNACYVNIFKRPALNKYFYCYICAQTVLQRDYNRTINAVIKKSDESVYRLQQKCKYKKDCMKKLFWEDDEIKNLPYLKFPKRNRGKMGFEDVEYI